MSLTSSLNIARQALSVNQAAITVVSNNIANVNTDGYTKQRVNLAEVVNYTPTYGDSIMEANNCSGVRISSILSAQTNTNNYLDGYYRQENSDFNYLDQYSSIASGLEDLTNTMNNQGLSQAFNSFYEAANSLGNSPADATARESYIQSAKNVVMQFNSVSESLSSMKESLVGDPTDVNSLESSQIFNSVEEVNNIIDQVAKINNDIITTNASGNSSSALIDQRNILLKNLSTLTNVEIRSESNKTVTLSIGGKTLVEGKDVTGHLKVSSGDSTTPAIISIVTTDKPPLTKAANINNNITAGSMAALLDICGTGVENLTISAIESNLNTMASGFAKIMNDIQNGTPAGQAGTFAMCLDSNGKLTDSTENLFVTSDASATITAANISVNINLMNNTNLIAAARLDATEHAKGQAVYGQQIGNNSNAELLVNSRTKKYSETGNKSVEQYLANFVGNVGSQVENVNTNLDNQSKVLASVKNSLNTETGVSLDEELTDLIKYQQAYQASSRIFNVCNELLQGLMHLGE